MKLTIRIKLLASFLLVLVLLSAIAIISIYKMTNMGNEAIEIKNFQVPGMLNLANIRYDFTNLDRVVGRYAQSTDNREKEQILKDIQTYTTELDKNIKNFESLPLSSEEKNIFRQFKNNELAYTSLFPTFLQAVQTNDTEQMNLIIQETRTSVNYALDFISKDMNLVVQSTDQATENSVQLFTSGRLFVVVLSIIAILAGIVIVLIVSRLIATPMRQLVIAAESIAMGDLRANELTIRNRDEIADVANAFRKMRKHLREMLMKVGDTADQVAASSEELTASAEQTGKATEQVAQISEELATGSEKQVINVQQSMKALEIMSDKIFGIAANAETVSKTAAQAAGKAEHGNTSVQSAIEQMNEIQLTVQDIARLIKGLGERSQEIGQIVEVITGISSQTNLLALNAAIEAARAGEHGRGFAVVAAEVRKLAEQSASSAQKIAQLVEAIRTETSHAVHSMESGTQEVERGIQTVHVAGESFKDIQQSILQVSQQIQEVSTAANEITENTKQVTDSFTAISKITEMNAAGTQNVSAAAEEQLASMEEITASASALAKMSEELQSMIDKFQLE